MHHLKFLKKFLIMLLAFLFIGNSYAQERNVSGTIIDESGAPLPGVNIVIKGTTTGIVTDISGKFNIKVPGNDAVLAISYVGYEGQEIQVGQQTVINVTLKEEVKQLSEIVVIGYGVQKKSDLTGSVASVKASDIAKIPVTGIESALQGRAAGVQVSQNSGMPGSGVKIYVRGISTLTTVDDSNKAGPNGL